MSTNSTGTEPDVDTPHPFCEPADFRVPSGEQLRQLRILCDLSLEEVADRVDRRRNTISRWEQGERSPSVEDAAALLECYREASDGQTQLPST